MVFLLNILRNVKVGLMQVSCHKYAPTTLPYMLETFATVTAHARCMLRIRAKQKKARLDLVGQNKIRRGRD
jgi:hypothetical protein